MRPIFLRETEAFHHRISANITPLFICFSVVTNTVVKIICLPLHALKARCAALPVANYRGHSRFCWEDKHGMHMIGHDQEEIAPPVTKLVITLCCNQQFARKIRFREWRRLFRYCTNADVKEPSIFYPRGYRVMQTAWICI